MIDIFKIHIHYVDLSGKKKVKVLNPTDPESTLELKKDIARFITSIKRTAEYYYVVFEIDSHGKSIFRNVISKTFLHE